MSPNFTIRLKCYPLKRLTQDLSILQSHVFLMKMFRTVNMWLMSVVYILTLCCHSELLLATYQLWWIKIFKMANFGNSRRRTPDSRHFEYGFISISVANHPISMKFCVQMYNGPWEEWRDERSKFSICNMTAILAIVFATYGYSSDYREIWVEVVHLRAETRHVT